MTGRPLPRPVLIGLLLCALPLALFHRALLRGEAFVPADLLLHVAPWRGERDRQNLPPPHAWNVLRYDGITQHYPWRLQTARAWRRGQLPLWNPYAFSADGGTPLWANSQSAPLYPPNLLFALAPAERTGAVFGWLAALHLLIAACGTYRFARGTGLDRPPALLAATAFALSGPIVTWLSLPTFLSVICWLPWLLEAIRGAHAGAGTSAGRRAALAAGALAGLALLGGHLQIAFYVLLYASLYALSLGLPALRAGRVRPLPWLAAALALGALAGMLAAPQVLPSLELSRISHRAGATPSADGYRAYAAAGLPARSLTTFLYPDFFGHPNRGTHWNDSQNVDRENPQVRGNNYAEWAVYIGVAPLLLALLALLLPWRRDEPPPLRARRPFAALLAICLLLAMGTPLVAPFYFLVPGFSQSGSPARILFTVTFSLAILAGFGLQALGATLWSREQRGRALFFAVAALALMTAGGAQMAMRFNERLYPTLPFSARMEDAAPGLWWGTLLLAGAAALSAALPRLSPPRHRLAAAALGLLSAFDLLLWARDYNPTSPPDAVYPRTPGIVWLQANAGKALIAPLNQGWSLGASSPRGAILPPNALTVFGLHDIAGYDSLFPGASKRRIDEATGRDAAPAENGNLVFVKTREAALALGARFLLAAPLHTPFDPGLRLVYQGPDMEILENPAGQEAPPPPAYAPTSLRVGLFLAGCALAALSAAALAGRPRPGARV